MKMKLLILLIFLTGAVAANAQTYIISKTVNIFGDTVETYTDQSGKKLATVTHSTNIFGDKIKSMTGPNGEKIQSPKTSTDIFGDETKNITSVNSEEKPELLKLFMKLLLESEDY